MANEITSSSMVSDGALAAALVQEYFARPTQSGDFREAMIRKEFIPNMNARAMYVPLHDDNYVYDSASSETSGGYSNTDPNLGAVVLTPARKGKVFQSTNQAMASASLGTWQDIVIGPLANAVGRTVSAMACVAAATATAEVGDGTGPMTEDIMAEARRALMNSSQKGPFHCVMHPKAFGEFQDSLRAEGGSAAFSQATEEMQAARGETYQGMWRGVGVWVSDKVETSDAGAIRQNFLFAQGGLFYCEANAMDFLKGALESNVKVLPLGPAAVVQTYDADNGINKLTGEFYPAVSLGIDSAVVRVQTIVA